MNPAKPKAKALWRRRAIKRYHGLYPWGSIQEKKMVEKTDKEVYFTPKQAAECFNLSLSTIKNYIYAGKLNTLITPGGHHRISKAELLSVLEAKVNVAPVSETSDMRFAQVSCNALLNVFKTLGEPGSLFIIHGKRVLKIAYDLSKALSLSAKESRYIEMAALVHDIGNIGIDKRIMLKTGLLTSQEYEVIKKHPEIGKELLNSMNQMQEIADMVSQHHERMDGKGYPEGLTGSVITKGARIISIAEAYDSMVSEYSYKAPVSKDMAIAELIKHKGAQFDADMVEIFVKTI